ncbi:hypothetical protein B0H11DRAFT_2251850 [Mycena galericulata]|nr:hypothetical protein B0H11DRAFT_2251850 [Mycena galericulata]
MARNKRKRTEPALPSTSSAVGSSHAHNFTLADLAAEEESIPAFVHRVSEDQRRLYIEELPVEPPSPVKRLRLATRVERPVPEDTSAFNPGDGWTAHSFERYQLGVDDNGDYIPPQNLPEVDSQPGPTKQRVKPSDPSLSSWISNKRDWFLTILMCRSGPLDANRNICPGCAGATTQLPRFRCHECFGDVLYCEGCIVERHRENPLHRIHTISHRVRTEMVRRDFRQNIPGLTGLRVQVGHRVRKTCSVPIASNKNFVVLHDNGIHEVAVDFCGCENELVAGPPDIQLLRAGWFPATHERPQTCATLVVLEKYHLETLQAKTTMYDFYGVLEKLTDNTRIKPPDRYHEWIRMCREYRHLMLLKRGGRASSYATGGPAATGLGELAIQCPACPRPGVNLPEGWEDASPEERFLYTLFLALDACFRLKCRLVSSELKDPDLGPGWAYMVETEPYRAYLRGVTDQKEMNTCSGLAALDYANTKFSRGYSTTGVGMGVCARHEFVQANGVGDLQKGER